MEIKKKDLTFRGKTIEELKKLDVREFAKLLRSIPRRYTLRQFQKIELFVKRSQKKQEKGKKIKTHIRDIVIVPQLVGMNIQVYNGKTYTPVEITIETLGHKLGEFSPTRTKVKHSKSGVGASKATKTKAKK
jgi:small subunit ribosomal protein S19